MGKKKGSVYMYLVPRELDKRRKLTDEQKNEIRELHQSGESYNSIARKFGVTGTTVRNVVHPLSKEAIAERNRKAYKNITKEKRREYYLAHIERKKKLISEENALWE